MTQFIGRRVSVGLGLETTPGTPVAPATWQRHLSLDFQRKVKTIDNESALGRNEASDDSAVTQQWAEGTLEGKLSDVSIGYLLKNILGSVNSVAKTAPNAAVKDHTFDVAQTQVPPTLTIARKDPNSDRRHALGSLDSLEISWEGGEWVVINGDMRATSGTSVANTPAYTDETEFTSKHVTVKLAANVAGLAGATGIKTRSGNIRIERPSELFFPNGQLDPSTVTNGPTRVTGEVVLQYEDGTYETLSFANTAQAIQFSFTNTDVTIGSSANPGLVLTLPKARLREFDMSSDLDEIVDQTFALKGELSIADGYMIRAVLTNLTAGY